MTELKRIIGWLDKRVPTSDNAKPYIEFAMKEYAEKYHQSQLKNLESDSSMFSAEKLEQAYWDGRENESSAGGCFDIENYH